MTWNPVKVLQFGIAAECASPHYIVWSTSCMTEGVQLICANCHHYDDIIMSTIASQITSLTIVYSTVYSDADQRRHQSSASLAFVRGIHLGPVNSLHKWPVTQKMFPFDDVIMIKWSGGEVTSEIRKKKQLSMNPSIHWLLNYWYRIIPRFDACRQSVL